MPRKPVAALGERCRFAHLLWSEDIARLVQADRRQRGVELSLTRPEALESLRLELRDRCADAPMSRTSSRGCGGAHRRGSR